ncbi:MAG TPA: hypothetical protein DCZ92_15385 [Elusimicrobia bacterium]|nr:MAG: hypothetical protein A2016_06630 [Elusimicrobia bacterium GWF2_62_30]HBA62162.1 hypothetical protein [Elusimicrobiota bacterium]
MTGIFKRFARRMIKAEEEGLRTHKAVMRLLKKIPSAANLLDVGCGHGGKTPLYAEALRLSLDRVKGIEPQEKYAAVARAKFEVFSVDIESSVLPFPDSSFDVVVCNQVLEHLKNIFLPLREMDRVVRPGGWLLIGVPNLAGLYNRLLLLLGKQPISSEIDGPHVRSFAHHAFRGFLESNPNFELTAVDSANLYPLPYPLLERLGGHFPGLSAFTFYLLKKKTNAPEACTWKPGQAEDTCF